MIADANPRPQGRPRDNPIPVTTKEAPIQSGALFPRFETLKNTKHAKPAAAKNSAERTSDLGRIIFGI